MINGIIHKSNPYTQTLILYLFLVELKSFEINVALVLYPNAFSKQIKILYLWTAERIWLKTFGKVAQRPNNFSVQSLKRSVSVSLAQAIVKYAFYTCSKKEIKILRIQILGLC